jgi:hypothetical protein
MRRAEDAQAKNQKGQWGPGWGYGGGWGHPGWGYGGGWRGGWTEW